MCGNRRTHCKPFRYAVGSLYAEAEAWEARSPQTHIHVDIAVRRFLQRELSRAWKIPSQSEIVNEKLLNHSDLYSSCPSLENVMNFAFCWCCCATNDYFDWLTTALICCSIDRKPFLPDCDSHLAASDAIRLSAVTWHSILDSSLPTPRTVFESTITRMETMRDATQLQLASTTVTIEPTSTNRYAA